MPKYYSPSDVKSALPEYSIERHIDSGGFKDVFLAKANGDTIVVKLIPTERTSRKRRARREAEAMVKINSPNFVDLRDFFQIKIGGTSSFLLEEEYIDGPTLREMIEDEQYGIKLGFQVTETLLNLLIQFSKINIIHRDIKPSNIMFDEMGEMILLDIGIVRFEERDSITPDHAGRLGTPNYGAPEQLDYNKELQSIRTDIFSTGIVMFEALTGIHPYSNKGKSISEAIMDGDKSELQELLDGDGISEPLGEMFEIMTETKPYNRYRKPRFALEKFNEIIVEA
jgi:serine/threonine-protein kinase